jgi:hypothetical protein
VALPEPFEQDDVLAFRSAAGMPLTRVGRVRAGAGLLAELAGKPVALAGFDHFVRRGR